MTQSRSYRIAFITAIILHVSMLILLTFEHHNKRPVLTLEAKNEPGHAQPSIQEQQAIKAVTVDSQDVMKTMNQLKAERARQQQAELNRQRALQQQAELARKQRVQEQQRLEKLKQEAEQLAIARQKQIAEEQQRLKQLALQKQEQEKHLAEMKKQQELMQKQQQEEAKKLAEMQKKKVEEQARSERLKQEQVRQELAKKKAAEAQQAAQQAALEAARTARIAGEVDKYKALIINAISQQWILPENANSNLSSQFRIRLAPNGAVLQVSLIRSSGDPILDRSAQAAIYKASPLPVPTDAATFDLFRDISLTVRPTNARG